MISTGWQLVAAGAGSTEPPTTGWTSASVPGTAASALRAAGTWSLDGAPRRFDAEDWWWRVEITGEPGAMILGLDGIATLADVYWNDVRIGSTDNMFVPVTFSVVATGTDRLAICCRALDAELAKKRPRPRWRVPMIEQQQLRWVRTTLLGRTPGWSPPAAAVGPWRPVWLARADALRVDDVQLHARLVDDDGVIDVSFAGELDDATLVVDGTATSCVRDGARWRARVTLPNVRRWWPHTHGEPFRYPLRLDATRGDVREAIALPATGFRTIEIARDGGDFAVHVNGVRVFCRGACWTPLDVVSLAATPAQYDQAVARMVEGGMNMLRIGGTMVYEDAALYDALDAHGVLLWQDLMFANMDYPDELAPQIAREVETQLARLVGRPALAIVCGNSEGQQQAAMSGATSDRWAPSLFHATIAALVARAGVAYVPSSTDGGAFPHQPRHGVASYYGVGAYLRPLDDARRSEVRFASECLAFANLGSGELAGLRVHHAAWKARSPRDLGAGWDFDDVRDHYVAELFELDPAALRAIDHDRYVALGRVATGEVMAQTFGEWRRGRSPTRGGLIWFLRDLWAGAGWGVVDATGAPKPCWYALRRALAPIALAITDEGCNGLAIHVVNDGPHARAARLALTMYRAGEIQIGTGARAVVVPAHGALEIDAAALFDGFYDLSYAYRFGPPQAQVVHARLLADRADGTDEVLAETFWFPSHAMPRELAVGLTATVEAGALVVATTRFAQFVAIEGNHLDPEDNYFHLAPGQRRVIPLRARAATRGTVTALNAESGARFEVKP
ncbi:MAG: glycoside hydrolase family 2 protein [Proteobacteria bacterium]|nr:glycoside hydrolase family 2 protein [Pseudomonadota bacterium]